MKLDEKYNAFLNYILKTETENFIKDQVQIQTNPKCGRYSVEDEIWDLAYFADVDVYDFCKWLENSKKFKFDVL